jgi:hypothetical protein
MKASKVGIVIKELNKISDAHEGILQPRDIINAARPKSSPLHPYFEWDNTKAAHAYRLWQARNLISIAVEVIPGSKTKVRVYVSLKKDQKTSGGYRPIVKVLSNKQLRRELIQDALLDLAIFEKKYRRLNELAGIFREAQKVRRMLS